ncbi:hypothetical protein HK101_004366, partial [Irineochytrium annulatum]
SANDVGAPRKDGVVGVGGTRSEKKFDVGGLLGSEEEIGYEDDDDDIFDRGPVLGRQKNVSGRRMDDMDRNDDDAEETDSDDSGIIMRGNGVFHPFGDSGSGSAGAATGGNGEVTVPGGAGAWQSGSGGGASMAVGSGISDDLMLGGANHHMYPQPWTRRMNSDPSYLLNTSDLMLYNGKSSDKVAPTAPGGKYGFRPPPPEVVSSSAFDVEEVVRELIQFYAGDGNVQMCTTMALVLKGTIEFEKADLEAWCWGYV